jgi:peptidoglycan hydrolase-like protein with peptidoglycan-binding domain
MKKIIIALSFLGIFAGFATSSMAAYFSNAPAPRCDLQITHSLQLGSENSDVYVLQQMLAQAGFLYATPNGYFGQGTLQAVKLFQMNNGIPTTGTVGPTTRDAVNERLCDADPRGDSLSYGKYGYNSGVTYVDKYDPYVKVISPAVSSPMVYATPQTVMTPLNTAASPKSVASSLSYTSNTNLSSYSTSPVYNSAIDLSSQVQSTSVIYSPSIGYTYGIVPKTGSITVSSPLANTFYNEGDTVYVSWATSNIATIHFTVLLENTSTGQSKVAAVTSNKNTSFVLTKELLDAVCLGVCDNNQQGSFRVVITTPTTDIAGNTSTFRAAVAPVTIKRPLSWAGTVSITSNKSPVNSGEIFKLYINIPTGASWNANLSGNYSIKVRALCPSSVSVSVAGTFCGQDFVIPFAPVYFQQEIPAVITNPTWYKQDVTFEITVVNLSGAVIGTARTTVIANAAPFSW